mmetsp:Transcript_24011/g.36911  ORF Transcript_24011/g.36911 Transcript_24011/m.36911 type:complete len:184 (+) Transcript_24011:2288-2839(+)
MCFTSGDTELLHWNSDNKHLLRLPVDKSDEHEDALTCVDVLPELGLYVTGDHEGLIKVWNLQKQLIREIKFVEPVNSVIFLNKKGDIIVGHSGNLNRLNASEYMDSKMLIKTQQYESFIAEGQVIDENFFRDILNKPPSKLSLALPRHDLQSSKTLVPPVDIAEASRAEENISKQSKKKMVFN